MTYQSTKTFGHELGLSAAFRQWRANHSHCSFLHGYALSFHFVFEAEELDDRNWVVDFGGLKPLKNALQDTFDHKLAVAQDDPQLPLLMQLHDAGVADVIVLPAVGCEMFAQLAFQMARSYLEGTDMQKRVRILSCECREHGANSAIYKG
jgi:6-pyruvoyltetrahydropterin/6-carboxytetrahydropterin synthase